MKHLIGRGALVACLAILMLGLFVVPVPVPAEAKVLPPGSYRNSCKDCYVDNGWLHCRCKNGRDGRNDTRIKYTRCNGDISNVDGWLTCGGGGGQSHRVPGGSWRGSCRNGRVQGNELTAECRNGNGKWVQAWISLNKCPGNVSNEDGRLVCEGRGGHKWSMPGGSWRGSCRRARIEGDTLWAECRAKNGDWRGSRVNLRGCDNLKNCNGHLRCGHCDNNQIIR